MSQLQEAHGQVITSAEHLHRDAKGAKIGMWLFLFTELLLFTGMFLLYAAYRYIYSAEFHRAGLETNTLIGAFNTIILLTSSLTVAISIAAIERGEKRLSIAFLVTTVLLGFLFLVNKYFEWSSEISRGIYPASPKLMEQSNGENLFFGLYYAMTGLHGLHVVAGIIVLSSLVVLLVRNRITQGDPIKLENAGLYWHLVDIIWIFLFPLFYLIK